MRNPTLTVREWADWLSEADHAWHTFATFTSRYPDPTEAQLRRGMARLNERFRFPRFAWFCERGKVGTKRVHVHALVSHPLAKDRGLEADREYIARWWRGDRGRPRFGRCQLDEFDPKLGAAGYCAKYLTKRSFDYDYQTNLWRQ